MKVDWELADGLCQEPLWAPGYAHLWVTYTCIVCTIYIVLLTIIKYIIHNRIPYVDHNTPQYLCSTGKYAQVTNNPENDGCINAVLLV